MRKTLAGLAAIFALALIAPAAAEDVKAGDLVITQAWTRATPNGAKIGGGYLTIENKGPIPHEFRKAIGNRIYGCDDCLAVCPWNKFAQAGSEMRYRGIVGAPPLAELAVLDDAGFRARFSGSPIKRIGRDRFVRNVLYAIGNSGDPSLAELARGLTGDADPAVADAARWASDRLRTRAGG